MRVCVCAQSKHPDFLFSELYTIIVQNAYHAYRDGGFRFIGRLDFDQVCSSAR